MTIGLVAGCTLLSKGKGWMGVFTFCLRKGDPVGGGVGGCTHLLFEERPSEGDPLFELFALALVLRLGLHLDLALVRRQQLVLLLQTLLLLLRLRHLRLVQLDLHHKKNGKFHDLLTGRKPCRSKLSYFLACWVCDAMNTRRLESGNLVGHCVVTHSSLNLYSFQPKSGLSINISSQL